MDSDRGTEDDGPFFSWLPPEDRLWRHPSEVPSGQAGGTVSAPSKRTKILSEALNNFTTGPGRIWSIALIAGLVGATAASGIGMMTGAFTQQTTVLRSVISSSPVVTLAATSSGVNWSTIDNSVAPAVVSLAVYSVGTPSLGSGLILKTDQYGDAYVVTDRMLFAQADTTDYLDRIDVTFQSGASVRGRLLREDPLSGLALIEVTDPDLVMASIGSVADIHLADPIMAMAGPASQGGTVFTGTISAEDQTVPLVEGSDMDNLLAVASPINAAQAGGPLVDQDGHVVGITINLDLADPDENNLTYAVPIDEAQRVVSEIILRQALSHPWVGITDSSDVPTAVAHQLGLTGGARAGAVISNSPASALGITPGDIITSFDGHQIDSAGSLISALDSCETGRWARISYFSVQGRSVTADIQVKNEPDDS